MNVNRIVALAALLPALALGACGSDSGSGDATAANAGKATTVSVSSIGGQDVLVDASGAALYTPAQEAGGKIVCTAGCTSIWMPLMASGGAPTGGDGVTGTLGTVKRPDGGTQVTYDGAPLYTFAEDKAGEASGDGVNDSFSGTAFTWHVVTPSGPSTGSSGGSSGGGGGGGSGDSGGGYSY
jgi:predicted lipoprotein with Yx(FWY)xxD motif